MSRLRAASEGTKTRGRLSPLLTSARPQQVLLWLFVAYGLFYVTYWIVDDRRKGAPLTDSSLVLALLVLLVGLLVREPWRSRVVFVVGAFVLPVVDQLNYHLRAQGSGIIPLAGLVVTSFVLAYGRKGVRLAVAFVAWVVWGLYDESRIGGDGSTVQLIVPAAVLSGVAGWSLGFLVRRRRAAEAELRTLAERRRRERIGLARELHDSVARDLTIIAMQSAVLRSTDRPEEQEYAREAIETTARSGLDALKRLLVVLRAEEAVEAPELVRDLDAEDLGETLRQAMRHLAFLGYQVTASDAPPDLPRAAETTAVRVVREGTTNITKHAPAGALCHLDCATVGGQLVVRVENRCDAEDVAPRTPSTGLGLGSLAERLRLLGGTLERGATNGTWVLEARIPLSAPLAGSVGGTAGS